jgi:hypothetical protein
MSGKSDRELSKKVAYQKLVEKMKRRIPPTINENPDNSFLGRVRRPNWLPVDYKPYEH